MAINTHYLATEFDKAEECSRAPSRHAKTRCSPQTLARAWMYIGIVRGSGKSNIAGAKEAFQSAVALDASVKLDVALATAETQAAFNETASGGGGAAPVAEAPVAAGGSDEPSETPSGEGLDCTPTAAEIETSPNHPGAVHVRRGRDLDGASLQELRQRVVEDGSNDEERRQLPRRGAVR